MAADSFEIVRTFLGNAITNNNGQVIIHQESIKNLCNALCNDFCLIDYCKRKTLENDEAQAVFCTKFNWFYNQLMHIAIHNTVER